MHLGKMLIVIGLLIVLAGIVLYFFPDKLQWIGRLPGDIRIERPNMKIYFPITTIILINLLIALIFRLFK